MMTDSQCLSAEYLLDREVSWLAFNRRVLELAEQPRVPLLERLRFLAIFSSNLDEFYMKRIGGLKRQIRVGLQKTNRFGRSPSEEVLLISELIKPLIQSAHVLFTRQLIPQLEQEGIFFRSYAELNESQRVYLDRYFVDNMYPLLTPLSVDAGHPFPIISNLSTSLGVALYQKDDEQLQFARVKVSHIANQLVQLPARGEKLFEFIAIESIVAEQLSRLFPGMEVAGVMPFRVTRNAGLDVANDDDADDLLELIEEELQQRRFAEVVRIQHPPNAHSFLKNFLIEHLEVTPSDLTEMPSSTLSYQSFLSVVDLPLPALRYPSWVPRIDTEKAEESSLFAQIRSKDMLLHHPYDSFHSTVERFLQEATSDPNVQSIKMTVYRVGDASPLIPLLVRAAELGKNVVCLIEVLARFDEEQNIQWAYTLEDAGVHVVYGVPGLKTHAKTLLVVRRESGTLRAYAHIGTGNYHTSTAKLYTDLGILTSRPEITAELVDFFNYLTGRSLKDDYEALVVAPLGMEERLLQHIEAEAEAARANKPARIIAVLNNLEDPHVIQALYRASQAGVPISLVVRGICCLRPGLKGLSENIDVRSILGRFLEHSRFCYFRCQAQDEENGAFYITSADWMSRNLHRRVELALPVLSHEMKQTLWKRVQTLLRPDAFCWLLGADGMYRQNDEASVDVQEIFMAERS